MRAILDNVAQPVPQTTVFQRLGFSADLIAKLVLYPIGRLVEHKDRVE